MTCECKSNITARLLARAKENLPESKDHSVEIQGYAFVFTNDNSLDLRGSAIVEIQHTAKHRKTGADVAKKVKEKLLFTYCPFCGTRYKPLEESK